ncbi:MAG: hypothetical protein ACE5FD_11060, partial [Anaerolineae bacterium]
MNTRFSLPIIILLVIVLGLITIGGWAVAETAVQNDASVSSAAWDRNFTAAFPSRVTAVFTPTIYLPIILKPGSGLRDFALPVPLFAADSAWRQTATGASPLPGSDAQILVTYRVLRGNTTDQRPTSQPPTTNWPYMDVTYDEFTIPIFRAGTGQQNVLICDYGGNLSWPSPKFGISEEGGPVPVPAPAGTVRPNGPQNTEADGHLVLYNAATFEEYDFWQATTVRSAECASLGGGREGTTILEAGAIEFFDVRGSGSNLDTLSSARATGIPLLAGMILPEDVENGTIAHALGFALPGLRNLNADPTEPSASDFFYPTSTTETDFYSVNASHLAAGQRIRLKPTIVDENGDTIDEANDLAPITQMFLTALRTYGAYAVDSATFLSRLRTSLISCANCICP